MTKSEALTQALILAIIAPTEEQSERASYMAAWISDGMTEMQVETCKAAALLETIKCATH